MWSYTVQKAAHFHYIVLSCANYFFVYFLPKCNIHINVHRLISTPAIITAVSVYAIASVWDSHQHHTQAWLLSLSQRKVGSESVLELDHCSSVSCTRLGSTHSLWTGHFGSVTPETNITPYTAVKTETLLKITPNCTLMQVDTEILSHLIRLKWRHGALMEGSDQIYTRAALAPGKRFTKTIKHKPECVLEPV